LIEDIKKGDMAIIESPKRIWPIISFNGEINKVVWGNISESQKKRTPSHLFKPMVYVGTEKVFDNWMKITLHKFFSSNGEYLYFQTDDFKHLEKIE
tara:strand:- start:70183 stop:70470 length:288 start_codon:yes stop_codon:yes gene_type:complete